MQSHARLQGISYVLKLISRVELTAADSHLYLLLSPQIKQIVEKNEIGNDCCSVHPCSGIDSTKHQSAVEGLCVNS